MNEELDFTIVTPSYNYSNYIRECLDSVVAQEGVTYEHLVYDAGSTDGTIDIIREYAHVDLTVEPDEGMSDAINKGFKAAKGEWVMWLNTDDRLKPGSLAEVKARAMNHPESDVLYGGWDFIDAEGHFQRRMGVFPFRRLMFVHLHCYLGSTATFLRRSSTIEQGHLLNDNFKYVMDGEYYARLASQGKRFTYMKAVFADFRMHGENLSQKHLLKKDVDGVLAFQLQNAEPRTIRRIYGISLFKNDFLNGGVDSIIYIIFRLQKFILRRIYQPR